MRPVIARTDPAPSRLRYRLERMRLTPSYHRLLRLGLPLLLVAGGVGGYLADESRRTALIDRAAEIRRQIETRPEFMVNLLSLDGASPEVAAQIHDLFPHDLPASSFDLDMPAIRDAIEGLPAVAEAALRIRQGGVLAVTITERTPVALWRTRTGIAVLDPGGTRIATIGRRGLRPELPVLAGDGADRAVPEALDILAAAEAIAQPVRGLVRMGERRWDLVLGDGKRILLPETAPVRALERVIALDAASDLLARDLVRIDMRLGTRPTVRMSAAADEEWWRIMSAAGVPGISSGAERQ